MKKAAQTGGKVHNRHYVVSGYTNSILLSPLYHDIKEITSSFAKKRMIFYKILSKKAARISLFKKTFRKGLAFYAYF